MTPQTGLFIVIEGIDDQQVDAQFELLGKRLKKEGYDVLALDFPRFQEPSSYFLRQYLSGKYGPAEKVGPYTSSLFYALDRYHMAAQISQSLEAGTAVLANRFTGSSMARLGAWFDSAEERRGFFLWLDSLEYRMLEIPRPDVTFVLSMPNSAASLVNPQNDGDSLVDNTAPALNSASLKASVEIYGDLCKLFPKDFKQIDMVRGGQALASDDVGKLIWEAVRPQLPPISSMSSQAQTVNNSRVSPNAYLKRRQNEWKITELGRAFLAEVVTNPDGPVYAFTDKLNAQTIAAAMAHFNRNGDDMRVTILNEFATSGDPNHKRLHKIIADYGDDSVRQLVGQHLVVEGASNLLTMELERGGFAAYQEQLPRYFYFDQKENNRGYRYFRPAQLDVKTAAKYVDILDQVFNLYSSLVQELSDYLKKRFKTTVNEHTDGAWRNIIRAQACDAARGVLPVATKSTIGMYASAHSLEELIMHLRGSDSHEARDAVEQILAETRKITPSFMERTDRAESGVAITAYQVKTRRDIAKLVSEHLGEDYGQQSEPVNLNGYWPKNELDIVPHILYEQSGLSLSKIEAEVDKWPIERKLEIFNTYMGERLNGRHKPGRALDMAHYSWDLVCDYGILRDLQREHMIGDLKWQALTPRYGYDMPALIDEAGLSDTYEQCFDLSARLYSDLQAAGYELEAQYATLLGHKMRWQVTYNAREAFRLHEQGTNPRGQPGYHKLLLKMHNKLAEVHPMLAAAMKFVNQGENTEQDSLTAERYNQHMFKQPSQG